MMSASRFLRIRLWQKLLVVLLLVITGVVFTLGYIAMQSQQEVIERQVLDVHQEVASVVAQQISAMLENAYRLLAATARIPDVQEFHDSTIQTVFDTLLSNFRIFTRMSLVDRTGRVVYSTMPHDPGELSQIFYSTIIKGNYESTYISDLNVISGNLPSITLAVPVRDKHYAVIGMIVCELDLRIFQPLLEQIRIGAGAVVAVTDGQGQFIAHSGDRAEVGRYLPEAQPVQQDRRPRFSTQVGHNILSCVTLSSFKPKVSFGGYKQPDWRVIVRQDRDSAYAESIRLKSRFLWFALIAVCIAVPFSIVVSLTFTRHIKALAGEAERLSRGDLDTPVAARSGDEVGELAETFEGMRRSLKQKVSELNTLYTVGQMISSVLNLSDLLKLILSKNIEIMKADRGSLMLFDEETGHLRIEVSEGLKDEFTEVQSDINTGVAGRVFRTGRDLLIRDALNSAELKEMKGDREIYPGTLLSVPLKVQERILGVLNVSKSEPDAFGESDRALFNALSVQGAIAIDNAVLYKMAITDGLTKLYLHRYFQQRLDQEITRSKRYGYHFSLIMLDIDHFKKFNDNYGHQNGDRALKAVSRLLMQSVREVDIPARYGGEEFAVICPEKHVGDALIPAERIRQTIESFEFFIREERVPITISLGISGWPDDATEKTWLIEKADKALYHSKEKGRNCVTMYSDLPEDQKA